MLAVELTFLTGRYVATAYDDRNRAEWPPHPARLFSAFVSAHFDTAPQVREEREALEWLEDQGAPAVHASSASQREIATFFVPVNDVSVVGSLDDEAHDVETARLDVERAEGKARAGAEKKLAKQQARLAEATRKAIAATAPGKETKEGAATAIALLPESRRKQPRTFPSVTPADPRVVFAWPTATPTDEQREVLDALAARVVRLGHSSSLVSVRVTDAAPVEGWVPDETGEVYEGDDARTLRVVAHGQLVALDDLFRLHEDTPGRIMPAVFQRYVRRRPREETAEDKTVFGEDWIVLRRLAGKAGGPRLPSMRGVELARTVRKAMLASYGDDAPEVLSGHATWGAPSQRAHVAYIPLPYVGNRHADGSILGVAIAIPRGASKDERAAVARALQRWHAAAATSGSGEDQLIVLPVHLGRSGDFMLSVLDEEPRRGSPLAIDGWCRPARTWASATPIALDRNPGDLRSKDSSAEASAYAEAEATIAKACEHIGLAARPRVTVLPAAPLAGAEKARAFPAFLAGKPPLQRVLVHAVLRFATPVRGPILLGAGRYVGLGLFRPLEGDDV